MSRYIDADNLKTVLKTLGNKMTSAGQLMIEEVCMVIDDVLTADVRENVHGEWIVKGQDVYCSHCKKESGYNWHGASAFSNYCPNCGADMRGETCQITT